MDKDTIYRQTAIDAVQGIGRLATLPDNDAVVRMSAVEYVLFNLPSEQPEITDEQAIEHLQLTGWMQNHDREMYDMGFKEQLADDSGSYDSLLPSAQPEYEVVTPRQLHDFMESGGLYEWMDWFQRAQFLNEMGFVICRKVNQCTT